MVDSYQGMCGVMAVRYYFIVFLFVLLSFGLSCPVSFFK